MSKNLKLYGKEYYEYTEFLSLGNVYYILISKRLLLKPVLPIWLFLLGVFLVRNHIFFAMVALPSLLVFTIFLVMLFPLWEACNISVKAYIVFHNSCIIILKTISIPLSMLLEVFWNLCF